MHKDRLHIMMDLPFKSNPPFEREHRLNLRGSNSIRFPKVLCLCLCEDLNSAHRMKVPELDVTNPRILGNEGLRRSLAAVHPQSCGLGRELNNQQAGNLHARSPRA